MMRLNTNQKAFFALLRAGLWEQGTCLSDYEQIDFHAVFELSEEQSVIGLVTAGLEHVGDMKVPTEEALHFIGQSLQIELQNKEMNVFLARLIEKFSREDINAILVKGQGIAQCYEKPLWRCSGDVDLFLDDENYEKAKKYLIPLASSVDEEDLETKHMGLTIDPWVVELHGSLRGGVSKRQNAMVDNVQEDTFRNGKVRVWNDNGTDIFLPAPDNDVIFIFNHFVDHFYRGGLGLRQVCDWCRLLCTYRETFDRVLLEKRLYKMGFLNEWKAFAALAVDFLGMPAEVMPMYDSSRRWSRKARQIVSFILEVGNFGHNRDNSFYEKYPYVIYKVISLWRHIGDFFRYLFIFPENSINVLIKTFFNGLRVMTKGA